MSIKRAVQYSLFSSAIITSLISLCICSIVECLFLNSNWCSGISFFLSLLLFLSGNILENTGSSDALKPSETQRERLWVRHPRLPHTPGQRRAAPAVPTG